ncbi:toll/interleukin-1 receptor domain-containing protein [Azoarcus olearius]|uniref:TIR domain-containing protein n=1 Tax=Azoarcus sp. (strain BH72) TaxID=418699 RepID=A1K8M8_AZOSB|nr:toll/interleukin-1 receptor domain-containing protein [Azoarcus olearius]CAL95183.1 hypothetical protein azo2566 [Azoarcus olearius]
MWDVFISHAAEDKDAIARPLAEALAAAGMRVWYDDHTLRLGDGLRETIDEGLATSRYGIVILSPSFFAKAWPRRELDGLTTREISGGKTILPVWHQVSRAEVERFSPPLADKLGVSTDHGLDVVVREVLRVLRDERTPPRTTPESAPTTPTPPAPAPRPDWRTRWMAAAALPLAVAGLVGYQQYQRGAAAEAARAAIAGNWVIAATDKTPRTELKLALRDGRLSGSSVMAFSDHPDMVVSGLAQRRQVAIDDGEATDGHLSFSTRRQYTRSLGDASTLTDLVHRYEGRLEDGVLRLAVQVEGGYYEEVTATRADEGAAR